MRRPVASAPILAASLLSLGCGEEYAALEENQVAQGLEAAARVNGDRLSELVEEIHAVRVNDPAPDKGHGDDCGKGPGCVYSRLPARELIRAAWSSEREQRRDDDGFSTTNLFLDIPGVTRPDEWVLATAHYDAWFGGANDNATGTAVLLEAAAALGGLRLDRSVRLLLADGEELGMIGSGRYVDEYGTDGVFVVLNADMVAHRGTLGDLLTREDHDVEYLLQANEDSAAFAHQMADLARRLPAPVALKPIVFPRDGVSLAGVAVGSVFSDHAHFWLAGTPALFPFPAGGMPSWYHTVEDTPDKVDQDRLQRMGRLLAASLAAFATVPR